MDQKLLDSLKSTITNSKLQGSVVDEELIYDTLYNCGTWLNEQQISEYARELRKFFGVVGPREMK